MVKTSKYNIYKWSKFIILSLVVIFLFYFKLNMPISLVLIFELLLIIQLLPISSFTEKRIIKYYPEYKKFNIWVKRLILLVVFILVYLILKFIIIDIILTKIFDIPVQAQIKDFVKSVG